MAEIGTPNARASFHTLKVFDHVTSTTIISDSIVQPHAALMTERPSRIVTVLSVNLVD